MDHPNFQIPSKLSKNPKFPSCKFTNLLREFLNNIFSQLSLPFAAALAGRFPTASSTLAFALAFALALASNTQARSNLPQKAETLRSKYQSHDGSKGISYMIHGEVYLPWAPKTVKNKGVGHLKPRLFTMKTSKHVSLGGPW